MKKLLAIILALAIIAPTSLAATDPATPTTPTPTISAAPTSTPIPNSLTRQYVARMYNILLQKNLPGAVDQWTQKLEKKEITAAEFALKMVESSSFSKRKISDSLYVVLIYRALFGREITASAKKTWTTKLRNGYTRRAILKGFLDTASFASVCKAASIDKGTIRERAYNRAENFTDQMYSKIIAKVPTLKQILGYTNKYALGASSAATLVDNLFKSKTYTARKTSDEQYIYDIFGIIGVTPSQVQVKSRKTLLKQGYSRRYLLDQIVKTRIFKNLCSAAMVPVGSIALTEADRPAPKPTPTPTPVAAYPNAVAIREKLISLYKGSGQWNPKGAYAGEDSMSIPVHDGGFSSNDKIAEYYYRNKYGGTSFEANLGCGISSVTVAIIGDYAEISTTCYVLNP